MLVLAIKKEERMVIGDGEIVVTVLEIRGDKVRLGVTAARDIPVHRGVVWDRMQAERIAEQVLS